VSGRRFVRIIPDPDPRADAGSRIRVDYDPDDTGAFCIADENVLPEKLLDPNCYRVQTIANVELGRDTARSLRDALIDLCKHLDDEGHASREAAYREARAAMVDSAFELDARMIVAAEHGVPLSAVHVVTAEPELAERCPHGNMSRAAGSGSWHDWHRGHGCHPDPDAPKKDAP